MPSPLTRTRVLPPAQTCGAGRSLSICSAARYTVRLFCCKPLLQGAAPLTRHMSASRAACGASLAAQSCLARAWQLVPACMWQGLRWYACVHMHLCVCMHACVCQCSCVCICVCQCPCACMCVCVPAVPVYVCLHLAPAQRSSLSPFLAQAVHHPITQVASLTALSAPASFRGQLAHELENAAWACAVGPPAHDAQGMVLQQIVSQTCVQVPCKRGPAGCGGLPGGARAAAAKAATAAAGAYQA